MSKAEDLEKRLAEIQTYVEAWSAEESEKSEQVRMHQYRHIKTVEDYMGLQLEAIKLNNQIMGDIRDCLKSFLLSKMKTGRRVPNDSN
jgi:hypothetical protein